MRERADCSWQMRTKLQALKQHNAHHVLPKITTVHSQLSRCGKAAGGWLYWDSMVTTCSQLVHFNSLGGKIRRDYLALAAFKATSARTFDVRGIVSAVCLNLSIHASIHPSIHPSIYLTV
jgi:hypothetical protein